MRCPNKELLRGINGTKLSGVLSTEVLATFSLFVIQKPEA